MCFWPKMASWSRFLTFSHPRFFQKKNPHTHMKGDFRSNKKCRRFFFVYFPQGELQSRKHAGVGSKKIKKEYILFIIVWCLSFQWWKFVANNSCLSCQTCEMNDRCKQRIEEIWKDESPTVWCGQCYCALLGFATAAFNVRNGHDVEPSAHHRGANDHRSEGIKS